MSETLLIDPILDGEVRMQGNGVLCVYAMDLMRDENDCEAADPTSWPLLLIAPHYELESV
jgi:hypothetical protein